ncbi:hypothetical protein BS78_03G175000 [Paspalum vaginatum]|nr:hypothetical protein BS78_03G175000 [Paspalum vaginatum]
MDGDGSPDNLPRRPSSCTPEQAGSTTRLPPWQSSPGPSSAMATVTLVLIDLLDSGEASSVVRRLTASDPSVFVHVLSPPSLVGAEPTRRSSSTARRDTRHLQR